MPTYQYVCTDCGTPLEAVQSFSDAALTECPSCGGKLRKVFSAVGVVFKGSGFYKTDSRSPSSTSSSSGSSSSGDSATSAPAAAGTKPESKPAAKTEKTTTAPAASSTT